MGCSQSRPANIQQRFLDLEAHLKLSSLSIHQIQQASEDYFGVVNYITYKNALRIIHKLGITYSFEEEQIFRAFFTSFFAMEEEDIEYFSLSAFLLSLCLLTSEKQEAKATSIFEILCDCHGTIQLKYIENVVLEIIRVVRIYTTKLLKTTGTSLHIRDFKTKQKTETLMPKIVSYCQKRYQVPLSRQNFVEMIQKVSKIRGFPDLTNPGSIRTAFMDFSFSKEFIHIELQSFTNTPDQEDSYIGDRQEQ